MQTLILILFNVMIYYEKEVVGYLGIPSIPKKTWDGKSPFDKGVAVVKLKGGDEAYAVCTFNPDKHEQPQVTKVFNLEQFSGIDRIFVVPSYIVNEDEVEDMDLDDESKKKARSLLDEASVLENEGVEEKTVTMEDLPEWIFPEINNKEEAEAWLKRFNSKNKIRSRIPKSVENLKLRLFAIYSELNKR